MNLEYLRDTRIDEDQVKSMLITLIESGFHTQLSRLINLDPVLFIKVINAIHFGIITIVEISSLDILNEDSIDTLLEEAIVRARLNENLKGNKEIYDYLVLGSDTTDINSESLGMQFKLAEARYNISSLDYFNLTSCKLKYELFFENQNNRSYNTSLDFEKDFSEKVLPHLFEEFSVSSITNLFPHDGSILFDIATIPNEVIRNISIAIYNQLFNEYIEYLTDEKVYKLNISSSILKSKADCSHTYLSEFVNYKYPFSNTGNVIDEVISKMIEYEETEIILNNSSYLYILNEILNPVIDGNKVNSLNRVLILMEIMAKVSEKEAYLDLSPEDIRTSISMINLKMDNFKKLILRISDFSRDKLKVYNK